MDMYIDYGRNNRRPRKGRRILAVVLIVVLAGAMGFGAYKVAGKYLDTMRQQELEASLTPAPTSVASAIDEYENGAYAQTGIYGLWSMSSEESTEEQEESIYAHLDDDLWMADFVDTRERVDAKGIYLSAQKLNSKYKDALKIIENSELNAIVIDIKSDYGSISYKMDCPTAKEAGALTVTVPDVHAMLDELHGKGIYVIARIVTMKDPVISKVRPDLCIKKTDGSLYKDNSGYTWLNPYCDEAWDYIIDVCKCCAIDGFDEVNLDYIRFPTDKGNLKTDESTEYGEIPEEVTRIDAISEGIRRLCEEVKPLGAFVSCDLFGAVITSSVDARIVGQSYFRMAQYLDYLCPMVYPSHYANGYYNLDYPDCHPYELVYHAMLDSQKVLYMIDDAGNKADVRPWLQDFTASWVKHHLNYGKTEVADQIRAVYDAGYSGWLLWNAGIVYTTEALGPPEGD